jgi:hypothetical protein
MTPDDPIDPRSQEVSINQDAILIAPDGDCAHSMCSVRLSSNGIDCRGGVMPFGGADSIPRFAGKNGVSLQLNDGRMIAVVHINQQGKFVGSFIDPTKPYIASVLVRNVRLLTKLRPHDLGDFSPATHVDFGEFTVREIGSRNFDEARLLLSYESVNPYDFILEKRYATLPPTDSGSPSGVGGIPDDLTDLLFLLRLYKGGDLAFAKIAITKPNGQTVHMWQYDIVNDLNSNALWETKLNETERDNWRQFAGEMRTSPSWQSNWFVRAKDAFLRGGSREFNPGIGVLDRIIDYMTALETVLVSEDKFVSKRLTERGARLLNTDEQGIEKCVTLLKRLYTLRSILVHGNVVSDDELKWVREQQWEWEHVVRSILARAVELKADDLTRKTVLSAIYDISDQTIREHFGAIKDKALRRSFAEELADRGRKTATPATRKVTNCQRVEEFLETNRSKAFCDDCITSGLNLPRGQAQQLTLTLRRKPTYLHTETRCSGCGATKLSISAQCELT